MLNCKTILKTILTARDTIYEYFNTFCDDHMKVYKKWHECISNVLKCFCMKQRRTYNEFSLFSK